MKTCKNCGAQLEDQAKFCRYCGKPTEAEPAQDAGASYGQSAGSQDTGNMYGSQNTGNMYGGQNTGGMYGNRNTGNMYGQNAGGTYGGQNTGNMYGGQNAGYGGYQNPDTATADISSRLRLQRPAALPWEPWCWDWSEL